MSFYGEEQVRKVREATNLVDLFAEYGPVRPAGSEFVTCCPVHGEKTPSLRIYPDEHRWYCFGCKKGNDAIDLLRLKEGLDFEAALESLARRAGVELVAKGGERGRISADARVRRLACFAWACGWYADVLWSDPAAAPALAYLHGRGFTDDTLRTFGIGWAPGHGRLVEAARGQWADTDLAELDLAHERGGRLLDRFFDRVTIPICDRRGHPVAITARLLPEAEAAAKAAGLSLGKYINSTTTPLYEKRAVLFNLHRASPAARKAGRLFVLEGPLDVMAAHQSEVPECVATCGTALTPDHAAEIGKRQAEGERLVILYDGDKAGREQSAVAVETCLAAGLYPERGEVPGGKDAAALLLDGGTRAGVEAAADTARKPVAALLSAYGVPDSGDARARLAALDRILAVLATVPDRDLAVLWLDDIAPGLGLPLKTVRSRMKALTSPADPASPPAGEDAPPAQGEGGDMKYRAMVRQFVAFVDELGAKPDAMCGWRGEGTAADVSDGEIVQRFAHRQRMSGWNVVDHELKTASSVIVGQWRDERRGELIAGLTGKSATAAGEAALRKWVRGATGDERELDVAVIRHFLWQVKRLATGQVADWPIIPVLYGGQGIGKSVSIERLCLPLAELSFPIDASAITDERKSFVITRALVGRLEEMAGMGKADAEKLKAMATANLAVFRELYTMSVQQRRRTCSFIASSNLPLDAIIQDPTGVRRFYQIDCLSRDWDLINSLDPADIWAAVSESDPAPILPHLGALRDAQRLMVHHDIVSLWLRSDDWLELKIRRGDCDVPTIVKTYNPAHGYRFDDIAARLKFWCTGKGQAPPTPTRLRLRLRQEGCTYMRVRLTGGEIARECRWFLADRFLPQRVAGADGRVRLDDDRELDLGATDAPDATLPQPPPEPGTAGGSDPGLSEPGEEFPS